MEVSYELLWKLCDGFLLSFLVSGLVSLILYCSNSTDDDLSEQNMVKSSIHGGKKMKKRVKFFDQVDEDGFVKDIEVDDVNRFVGVEESGEKDEILRGGSGDNDVGLVDLSEKGGSFVGFDGGVVKGCVGVDLCLGGDVVDDQRERNWTNSCVKLASGENEADKMVGCGVDVSMCSDELVDDQRERNSMSSSVELASGEDEDGKTVGCDVDVRLCSDELVDDHRERNLTNWGNVYDDERIGKKLVSGENEIDQVDKIVGCDVHVSLGSDELVDDYRRQNLTNSSNVYEDEVHDVDRVDKIVGCDGFKKDRVVYDVDVSLGSHEVSDKIVDDHGIDLVQGKVEAVEDQMKEEAKVRSNVDSKERSCGVFDVEGMLNDEEEWEGIERSDLEKEFARAKCLVEKNDKGRRLVMAGGNDLMMELYGLEKVAVEGPCQEPQPMALKFAARAKWNAWQKLGNMSPEEAMEKYISVLSQNVPEWMEDHSYAVSKSHSVEEKVVSLADAQISTSLDQQFVNLRTSKVSDLADVSTSVGQVNSG